jgi:UDP-N-acetylmuramate: L-alanyl-gamma-D-glutamyl-meso-diaminopimelate ligase
MTLMTKPKHIHLIGICGTAMASLAGMLQERGFRVTGSDAASYPPMSTFLDSLGIPVAQPFAEANLESSSRSGGGGQRALPRQRGTRARS